MGNTNSEKYNKIESKLAQAQSMAEIILNNHNYACYGLDEPINNHTSTGNLMWALADLLDSTISDFNELEINGVNNND